MKNHMAHGAFLLLIKSLVIAILFVITAIVMFGCSKDTAKNEQLTVTCPELIALKNESGEWIAQALQAIRKNNYSIDCPSFSRDSAFFKLEAIAEEKSKCSKEAQVILLAFYSIFSNHPRG